ncbi:MAG: hypothetical protein ACRD9Y_10525 [Blastocatellia bacterium]
MKPARLIAFVIASAISIFATALAQNTNSPMAPGATPAPEKAPIEIITHKIGVEYYPMLDRPSQTAPPMTAETGDMPRTGNEQITRQGRVRFGVPPEDRRSRGRLRSYTRVIDDAQLVQVVVKNTEVKPIKLVEWDFAFPRYENGQLLSRYDVTTNVEIKPGAKKTLKHKLPAGAKRCEVVKVIGDENEPERINTFEAVCGQGFHDPSLLKQKQETISIKRIEYQDGTEWRKQ